MFAALVRREPTSAGGHDHVFAPLPFYSPVNAWFVATLKRVLNKERRRFARQLDLGDDAQRCAVARFLRESWILDQAEYHRNNANRRKRQVTWATRLRLWMIGALVAVAALHALGAGHSPDHDAVPLLSRLDLWVAFGTVALPAWAAAFHVMLSLDDHERLRERSRLMAGLLDGIADRLARVGSVKELEDCVNEAERILDLESAEFAESLIDRRPEFTG